MATDDAENKGALLQSHKTLNYRNVYRTTENQNTQFLLQQTASNCS